MKVKELIEVLQAEDQDAEVHLAYDYGDHWHTVVAPEVERVEEAAVIYSEYHRMPKIADDNDNEDHTAMAVVLFT